MNPKDFIRMWEHGGSRDGENERQGAQAYFLDLCELLDVPKPGTAGADEGYVFEKKTDAVGQVRGFADVFWRGRFAWENKAPGKNLDAALRQLLGYSLALANPPILVVCDRHTIRIHTQFNGHPSVQHVIEIKHLDDPIKRELLRRVWLDPESFRPKETNRDITEKAAKSFALLADGLRKRGPQDSPAREAYAEQIAHFLTQTVFCFFAEDVGLLPGRMMEKIVGNRHLSSQLLTDALQKLMDTMRSGGMFGADYVPWFNGGLFKQVSVPKLEITDITELRNASRLDWSAIDVSIFGTLFERGLDPAKRSQLGAHYTDTATIERIIEPVVRRPLLLNWEHAAQEIRRAMAKSVKKNDKHAKQAQAVYAAYLQSLADFKILDPACGSGNFLFLGLKALKDLEHQVITEAEVLGLERPVDLATGPANMLGIEINEYAAELARVTVWIGELQWRKDKGYPFKDNPILEPLDFIEHRDALLVRHPVRPEPNPVRPEPVEGPQFTYTEAQWPKVSVVIGNPPFLGGSKKRGELGDEYFEALASVFKDRVPGGADLVCYWFDKARKAIQTQGLGAAGLVATQSIRSGSNRKVLEAITRDTRIFDAWADEPWVNEGAAVRVSLVAMGWGECCFLNGQRVDAVTADLGDSSLGNITDSALLVANRDVSFEGVQKNGPFEIRGELARQWLRAPNPNQLSNRLVLRPYLNARDVASRPSDDWLIDFTGYDLQEAMLFEAPFSHIQHVVKPIRMAKREAYLSEKFWLLKRSSNDFRRVLGASQRYIVTPRVAKHRYFLFLDARILPDSRLNAICRTDDCTFGILSSRIHEVWSLAQASIHGDGADGGRPTYNAKSCFETFPFPAGLTPADTAHQRTEALEGGALIPAGLSSTAPKSQSSSKKQSLAGIESTQFAMNSGVNDFSLLEAASSVARAAQRLHTLRESWLNPPEWTQRLPEVIPLGMETSPYPDRILPRDNLSQQDLKSLSQRTLTNLYNQRALAQVQWLQSAHEQLDAAAAAAYGWSDYSPTMPDEEILKRLLALNLERASE